MISIITPVWNQSQLTHRFLSQHWANCAGDPDIEWIVVNNGSTDDTRNVLQSWQAIVGGRLTVIELPENIGFGPGNNEGACAAKGDILAFISNDVQILGSYGDLMRYPLEADPNALYGAEIFSHDTGWNTFKQIGSIAYVAGWCVIAQRDFWGKVGPWDPRYTPCDYEDLDLSYHVQQMGYPIKPISLPFRHDSGQSAVHLPGGRLETTLRNQRKFTEKWGLTLV